MSAAGSAPSLFEEAPTPVIATAGDWLRDLLTGAPATALCVLAIAFVGLTLMSGRFAIRQAARTVIGCFVLLGAPMIAAGLLATLEEPTATAAETSSAAYSAPPPAALPPASYDSYAGASLRQD